MASLTPQELAERLLSDRFQRTGPDVQAVTDPIADTAMVVTLDQLRPYDLNPRVTRNPRYDDIKASIRERGLDAPPAVTRRPGESHYIVRNGGNTRLAILHELWAETKDERFFRIPVLFRPWSSRGEIVALTGHLAENELHGGLSFIERALGVEKARELYERETGATLTQTELARRLTADGYPVTQSHISRMQDAVRYLLPAIPTVLYAGLGRPQVERLTALRKAASRTWDRYAAQKSLAIEFQTLFHDVLSTFDGDSDSFRIQRVQDELVGQMAEILAVDYDGLALELVDVEARHRALSRDPTRQAAPTASDEPVQPHSQSTRRIEPLHTASSAAHGPHHSQTSARPAVRITPAEPQTDGIPPVQAPQGQQVSEAHRHARVQAHIVSPTHTTDRLQTIQRTIADATGDQLHDFQANAVRAIPVQAGGLHPISDVWYIEPALDAPDRLRAHIAQLAREIAQEAELSEYIDSVPDGIGFACTNSLARPTGTSIPFLKRAVLALLNALSTGYLRSRRSTSEGIRLADDLGPLLQGRSSSSRTPPGADRLTDAGLVKLFRLIRLARRLLELDSPTGGHAEDKPRS